MSMMISSLILLRFISNFCGFFKDEFYLLEEILYEMDLPLNLCGFFKDKFYVLEETLHEMYLTPLGEFYLPSPNSTWHLVGENMEAK